MPNADQKIAMQIGTLTIQNAMLVDQVEQLQAENAALKKQVEDLKPPAEVPPAT